MRSLFVAARAVLWASGFIALWTWLALRARDADIAAGRYLPFAGVFPGLVLAALWAVLALACIVTFVIRGRGTPALFDPPRQFVASGPYRWVRNPMYVGAFALLVGAGLAFRSPSIVALAAVAVVLAHCVVVFVEEPGLESRFGDSYREYRRNVRRWLPRVTPWQPIGADRALWGGQ